jgi:hypothetical protein
MKKADKDARETAQFLDNLTEFVTSGERELSEIRDSLREQGVDPQESVQRFRKILSESAPTWREKAARERAVLTSSFKPQQRPAGRSRTEIQEEIEAVVSSMRAMGAPVEAGAYHRKFEEAQDEDLESLLEDLELQRDLLAKRLKKADSNG